MIGLRNIRPMGHLGIFFLTACLGRGGGGGSELVVAGRRVDLYLALPGHGLDHRRVGTEGRWSAELVADPVARRGGVPGGWPALPQRIAGGLEFRIETS
jgi:hypothetical protein